MAGTGVVQIGEQRFRIGGGQVIDGKVSLAEGKRASTVELTVADPDRQLANDLPLVLVEDVPAQRATIEVTFVSELGLADRAFVPKGTAVETSALDEALAGEAPERVRFKTDQALGPDDFAGADAQTLDQAEATVTATAVQPGADGNISGSPKVGEGESISMANPIPNIDRVYHTAPGTGGRNAGKSGEKVPVDCWLGRSSAEAPPKQIGGYLSQLTHQGPPGRLQLLAVDKSADMRREQKARAFQGTTVSDLVRRVASEHDFDVDLSRADLGDLPISRTLQHGATDWQFLNRVLTKVGHRVKTRGQTVYVTKVGKIRRDPEAVVLEPSDVSSYNFQVDELTKHTTPNLTALSGAKASDHRDGTPSKKRPVQHDRTGVPQTYDGTPSEIPQQKEREKQAEARKKRKFRCNLEAVDLYPQLDTDDHVVVRGFGRRYDGRWWIKGLTHHFDGHTSFQLHSDGSSE